MSNPKVFEFAKEIGMTPLALMDKIREWQIPVKSHMAELSPDELAQIKVKLGGGGSSGEEVKPAVPDFLPHASLPESERLNRLDLAKWLVSRENPLTARQFTNRLWKQFFGKGLSNVLDDLGNQGEWPSNPELLDWLASEFRDGGWDVKKIVRLIVNSHTYRQQSITDPELAERDPEVHGALLLGRCGP